MLGVIKSRRQFMQLYAVYFAVAECFAQGSFIWFPTPAFERLDDFRRLPWSDIHPHLLPAPVNELVFLPVAAVGADARRVSRRRIFSLPVVHSDCTPETPNKSLEVNSRQRFRF